MHDRPALTQLRERLESYGYMTDPSITMALYLSQALNKPLLVEGPAGVGKTEVAKILAQVLDTELIRLQCYEGIDASQALYEWNYQHQLMYLKVQETQGQSGQALETNLYDERFLLQRPILQAITAPKPVVLLIDEVDRSDEEFESFLLEVLSDWQVSIPETGTIRAKTIPWVVLTSNATRELSDALRRRCMYLYIDYPSYEKEVAIIKRKVPGVGDELVQQIARFMAELRDMRLQKHPGVAETLDWARALAKINITALDKALVSETLGLVLKDWRDQREVTMSLEDLLEKTGIESKVG